MIQAKLRIPFKTLENDYSKNKENCKQKYGLNPL